MEARRVVPIACTLNATDVPGRVEEWRTFLARSVDRVERGVSSARLRLAPGDEVLLAAASLGQREKECCAFFDFTIALEADARWLCVAVPEGAEAMLSDFIEQLGSP